MLFRSVSQSRYSGASQTYINDEYETVYIYVGKEVEFEIVKEYIDKHTNQVQEHAKLTPKTEQTNGERFEEFMKTVEYPELEGTMNLCEDIIKEKGELRYKDGTPMRSYNSPKIQELLDEIEKESVPSYREISDEEIYKASHREINHGGGSEGWIKAAFRQGAAWYREQLKKK